jgi:preprotein translocase subunit SecB
MSVLNFEGYRVKQMEYLRNEKFNASSQNIVFDPELHIKTNVDGTNIIVNLSVVVGSVDKKEFPFKVTCEVEGEFEYNATEDTEKVGLDTLARNNCTAILYPYVRALVSNLTNASNEFAGYNMPTINVAKVLDK